MLYVITSDTPAYQHSPELQLAFRMFKKAMPVGIILEVITVEEGDDEERAFRDRLSAMLEATKTDDYILIVRQSWIFLGQNTIAILSELLNESPGIDCVLPSDMRHYRSAAGVIDYHTLRGFERFVERLQNEDEPVMEYDGRDPFIFMVRGRVLQEIPLPDNVFSLPQGFPDRTAIALNAYAHEPVNYYGESRPEIVEMIPASVRSLLDIGCARGGFGSLLKSTRDCYVTGLELNPSQSAEAEKVLDRVIQGDALKAQIDKPVDCVTALDSLEHFTDPESLLNKIHQEFLTPGGYLVISIPNVGHWSIVEDLLAGRWDYVPIGLLCNTHFRFFTFSSIKELVQDCGFRVLEVSQLSTPLPKNMNEAVGLLVEKGMAIDRDNLEVVNYHIVAQAI